jgi:hypothetical protein
MDKPLRQLISELEDLVERLSHEMMQDDKTPAERNQLEAELRAAQQALERYEQTLKLE